ncbi:MAG: tetratricopeptide repeat protein, partial [Kiritimatiellae bacterium]|nr:tetratricopeptide repeat protein [Kiritimatiellia bacterium]
MKGRDLMMFGMRKTVVGLFVVGMLSLTAISADNSKMLLTEGRAAFEDQLYVVAQQRFEVYLQNAGNMPDTEKTIVIELLARAMCQQGKFSDVIELFKSKKKWQGKLFNSPMFRFWRALAYYEMGSFPQSLDELGKYGRNMKGSDYEGRAIRLFAWCLMKQGEIDDGLAAFAAFDAEHRDSLEGPANSLEWAQALVDAGQTKKAVEVFGRLTSLSTNIVAVQEGQYCFGQTLVSLKKLQKAEELFVAVAENKKANDDLRGLAWYSLAEVHADRTNMVVALQALSNGIERVTSPVLKMKGRLNQGRLLLKVGKVKEGIALLKVFIAKNPRDPLADDAQIKLAETLLDEGEFEEAADEFLHYLETFTNSIGRASACRGRGWGLLESGCYAEAATVFMKACDLFADAAEKEQCLFKAADASFANGQYRLARGRYQRLLDEYPDSALKPNVLLQLGESHARMDDYDASEKIFQQLMSLYPDNPMGEDAFLRIAAGKIQLAENAEKKGEWSRSSELFETAVEIFGTVIKTYTNGMFRADAMHGRGQVYYQMFEIKRALSDFDFIINNFPDSKILEHTHYMRGMCFYRMFREKEAMDIWKNFTARFPNSEWAPKVMFEVGKYEYNNNNYAKAEKLFLAFADKYKNDPLTYDALLWAGISAAKRKEYRHAVELFVGMIQKCPHGARILPRARFEQAGALSSLGKYSAAIVIFDEIINKYPASDMVLRSWLRKGDCQFMLGGVDKRRYEEAIKSFRVVVNNSDAGFENVLEAEYKIGKCKEML